MGEINPQLRNFMNSPSNVVSLDLKCAVCTIHSPHCRVQACGEALLPPSVSQIQHTIVGGAEQRMHPSIGLAPKTLMILREKRYKMLTRAVIIAGLRRMLPSTRRACATPSRVTTVGTTPQGSLLCALNAIPIRRSAIEFSVTGHTVHQSV